MNATDEALEVLECADVQVECSLEELLTAVEMEQEWDVMKHARDVTTRYRSGSPVRCETGERRITVEFVAFGDVAWCNEEGMRANYRRVPCGWYRIGDGHTDEPPADADTVACIEAALAHMASLRRRHPRPSTPDTFGRDSHARKMLLGV